MVNLHAYMIFGPDQLSVYSRLNILYLLDSLCENAFQMNMQEYKELIEKNLVNIIQMIAPENSQGEMNSHSAYKVRKCEGIVLYKYR